MQKMMFGSHTAQAASEKPNEPSDGVLGVKAMGPGKAEQTPQKRRSAQAHGAIRSPHTIKYKQRNTSAEHVVNNSDCDAPNCTTLELLRALI